MSIEFSKVRIPKYFREKHSHFIENLIFKIWSFTLTNVPKHLKTEIKQPSQVLCMLLCFHVNAKNLRSRSILVSIQLWETVEMLLPCRGQSTRALDEIFWDETTSMFHKLPQLELNSSPKYRPTFIISSQFHLGLFEN